MGNNNEALPPHGVKVTTTELVLRAVRENREVGRISTRAVIAEMTCLPLTIVDDRVKHLKAVGLIRLAGGVAGVFEPTEDRAEDRAVSATITPTGKVKVEIGDAIIELTMREARHLGALVGGIALQFRGA